MWARSAGMAKAIALATSGQPGPVHVDVPIGVAEGLADEAALAPMPPARPGLPPATEPVRPRHPRQSHQPK